MTPEEEARLARTARICVIIAGIGFAVALALLSIAAYDPIGRECERAFDGPVELRGYAVGSKVAYTLMPTNPPDGWRLDSHYGCLCPEHAHVADERGWP